MKVLEIQGTTATVEVGGVRRQADISMVSPVNVGDYVIVHAGFAISVSNAEEAQKTLALFDEIVAAQNEIEGKSRA